jgi:hypothetical protein
LKRNNGRRSMTWTCNAVTWGVPNAVAPGTSNYQSFAENIPTPITVPPVITQYSVSDIRVDLNISCPTTLTAGGSWVLGWGIYKSTWDAAAGGFGTLSPLDATFSVSSDDWIVRPRIRLFETTNGAQWPSMREPEIRVPGTHVVREGEALTLVFGNAAISTLPCSYMPSIQFKIGRLA